MRTNQTTLAGASTTVGGWVFISITLLLGPLGFVLLAGMAYAMYSQNLALGLVCGLLVLTPFLLTLIWVPLAGAAWLLDRPEPKREFAADTTRG
ncbi:MAG: hypothetical protein AB1646_04680 [Thermodesulfobacteriota bacterium]